MKKYLKYILLATVAMSFFSPVGAQYYDWGQNPASVTWSRIKTPDGSYVFPRSYGHQAARIVNYMDTVRADINNGFQLGPMKMPMLMQTQNFQSNGLVMLAPKRMEFIVTPSMSSYATPWTKQLTIHEYRHSVQYNNLERGFVKYLSAILGQQGSLMGTILLSYWFLEGDAVLAETQMTEFGRGLQPSFTMQYRAFCAEDMKFRRDQYFSGSYKYPMPSQYELGYQIVSYADTKYGHNAWGRVAKDAARNPIMLFTNHFWLSKKYYTTPKELFNETIDDLWAFWRTLPQTDDSSTPVSREGQTYTTYMSPVELPDGRILALKEDLQRSLKMVSVDPADGRESLLARVGAVNSPVSVAGGKAYWSEYRHSTFWAQRVNSQLISYDLSTGKRTVVKGERRATYPVAMDDGSYAAAEYNYDGSYTIKHGDWSTHIPDTVSVHGLAYDNLTAGFYFIGLSDAGMWIGRVSKTEPMRAVTVPNRSTMANLRARDGKLYYNSIATGKDEAHMYDLAVGREYAISQSKYGSFSPAPTANGIVLTTFSKNGYRLSAQDSMAFSSEVAWSKLPKNIVNPERRKWDVINMDAVKVSDTTNYETRKYRKGLNLVQVHSWAPFFFEPDKLIVDDEFNFGVGATLLSQNLLNSTVSQLSYRYKQSHHFIKGKFNYYGWAPKFEIEGEWGTRDQYDYRAGLGMFDTDYRPRDYYKINGMVYLPIMLSSGYHVRRFTPAVEIEHTNARIISDGIKFHNGRPYYESANDLKFKTGFQKLTASVQFSDNVRMAFRDFQPRWGYMVGASGSGNPFSDMYTNLVEVYGRVYTPGLAPNHGFRLRGSTQHRVGEGLYGFRSDDFFPRGADYDKLNPNEFSTFSVDYQFPLCYPDTGIQAVLYLTRIRVNLGFDMAFWKKDLRPIGGKRISDRTWSYGGDIYFDLIPISLPFNSQGSLRISIYKPSDSGVQIGAGVSLPL